MTFGKTALRCWLPAAALLLALLCPLPVAAARAGTAIPVSVRTDGAAADAVYTVELTPLDAAPAPVQRALTVKNGGTVYFTGFAFDEPGDYRYLVAERSGGAAHTTYDAHSYTVTVRVTGRPDGGLAAGLWAVRSGETAKADGVLFVNRYDPPETAAAAVTASTAMAGTRTVKAAANRGRLPHRSAGRRVLRKRHRVWHGVEKAVNRERQPPPTAKGRAVALPCPSRA